MKRLMGLLCGILAVVIVCVMGSGCGENNAAYTIAISIPAADHGWTGGIVSWAEKAKEDIEKAHPDVRVFVSSSKSSADQVSAVENLMLKRIDALVLLPNEPEQFTEICRKVKAAGIKLIVVDRQLKEDLSDLSVLGDNNNFGVVAAKALVKDLGGKGNIVVLEGIPCNVNTDRVNGFKEVLDEYPEIKILQSERTDWNTQKAQGVMENMLQKFDHIDAVWAGDDDVLAGALVAIEKSQRKDIKLTIGGGGSKFIIKKIMERDPIVRLTVTYPTKMIYDAAQEALKLHLEGKKDFAQKTIIIPSLPVTSENAKGFYMPDSRY